MTVWGGLLLLALVGISAGGMATPFLRRGHADGREGSFPEPVDPSSATRTTPEPKPKTGSRMRTRWVIGSLAAVAVITASAVMALDPGQGEASGALQGSDPLAFFESRVRDDPRDVAARLDLAHRYLDLDRADDAVEQYLVVLELEPTDPEAKAHLGLLRYLGGHGAQGLGLVNQALRTSPSYPEALFIKGVILQEGLDRPEPAADAFREYLEAAPFGSERQTAKGLIRRAASGKGPLG